MISLNINKMKVVINGKKIDIITDLDEFQKLIFNRLKHFECDFKENSENYIKIIKNEGFYIKIDNFMFEIKGKVIKTDIYTVLNNVISKIINSEINSYMHSVVVSRNQEGILIIGDFNSGKTTLKKHFNELGFKTNSTDQTWLKCDNKKLYMKKGSRIENGEIEMGIEYNHEILITKIIKVNNIKHKNLTEKFEITSEYLIKKKLTPFISWSSTTLIYTEKNKKPLIIFEKMGEFLDRIDFRKIRFYEVSGDPTVIVEEILKEVI